MGTTIGIVEIPAIEADRRHRAERRFAGQSLLEFVVRRVTEAQLIDEVVVVAADDPRSRQLLALAPPDVRTLVCEEADALARFATALRSGDFDAAVRVSLSSPFVDPVLIDRLVATGESQPNCDYVSYGCHRGTALLSNVGLFAEWCRADAVFRADLTATLTSDRANSTVFIHSHPEKFNLRIVPVPPQLDRDDFRLTIDVEEDWEHAQVIYEALGIEGLEWQRIAGLLDNQPQIRERMARLNHAVPG